MEIRNATDGDIPAIVGLLRVSLGESLVPKSEKYWSWKHVDNPFGRSPVLVAIEDSRIIGVRAFMRWRWTCNQQIIDAVRAVDTAVHPDHQGKGIFSKLTKKLLEKIEAEGVGFVFNTPNKSSMPGYLKMGWQKSGRLPIAVSVPRPVKTFFTRSPGKDQVTGKPVQELLALPGFADLLEANRDLYKDRWVTAHSLESLAWRYDRVPVENYYFDAVHDGTLNCAIIYRVKKLKRRTELRITDCFMRSNQDVNALRKLVERKADECRADFVTANGVAPFKLTVSLFSVSGWKVGPQVTVKKINLRQLEDFLGFSRWSPSLGDMELF